MASTQPWWQELPEDFHRHAHRTVLDDKHALKVRGSAALDMVMRTGLATAVLTAMTPNLLSKERRDLEQHLADFYREMADAADADKVFQRPPRSVKVRSRPAGILDFPPRGIAAEMLEFTSPYVALHPEMRAAYADLPHNHRAAAQHWRHPEGPRPTLIFVHGYSMDAYWVNRLMFSLQWFYRKGYDILLYTLPFHGSRRAPGDLFSGYGYFSKGFAHSNEAMLQAVHDLRVFMDYLEDSGVPAMGLSGLSLGGYITALTAAVDDRLAFAIPNAPVVLPADMMMEWQPLNWVFRVLQAQGGPGITEMRHAGALHCPLTYRPKISADRLLVIGGAGDRFTGPRYVNLLHEHWAGSRLHWFPGNHVMHLQQREYLRLMRVFMDEACSRPHTRISA